MGSIRKRTFFATLGYFSSVWIILSFIYWFLKNEGFSESNYLIASLLVLFLAAGWGYIISLSTIKINTTLLEKNSKDEKTLKRLMRIEESSIRLERLYKELLYSINKEINPVRKEIFSLKNTLYERIEYFKTFQRNSFKLDMEDISIKADKIGFEKMIDNLLMNAMKYSSKDSSITINFKDTILTIADSGIGMTQTELLSIYERYYQVDTAKDGKGIGLALVKAYCDEERIDIHIETEKNIGTTIYLNLVNLIQMLN